MFKRYTIFYQGWINCSQVITKTTGIQKSFEYFQNEEIAVSESKNEYLSYNLLYKMNEQTDATDLHSRIDIYLYDFVNCLCKGK